MVVHPGSTGFHVPGPTQGPRRAVRSGFAYGLSPAAAGPPMPFRSPVDLAPGAAAPGCAAPATPSAEPLPGMPARRFGHRSLSLAATRGVSRLISSSGYLDVSVPWVVLPRPMRSGRDMHTSVHGFAHSRPPGRRMCAPRRGLSQLAASFIGSLCQGIRRAPVVSCGTASGPRDIHVSLKLINRYHE